MSRSLPRDLMNERPSKLRKQMHHGPPFATAPVPLGTDGFASLPPRWPPVEYSLADFYRGPAIYGENAWSQSHGIGQIDQSFAKPLPTEDQSGLAFFQPASSLTQAPPRALSTVSSVTFSSPSVISQPSSAESAVSPTQTDFPYEWPTRRTSPSTNSSVTQAVIQRPRSRAQSRFVCLGPHCDESFDQEQDFKSHCKTVHTHTCNWAGCDQSSFSTKDGLTWHVKLEHLLVCPAPGCTESSFQTKQILESHIRCAHPEASGEGRGKGKGPETTSKSMAQAMASTNSSQGPNAVVAPSQNPNEDRAIKQVLSVAVSKKKCREQLRNVVEKKFRRQNGQTPRTADSPSDFSRARLCRLTENASFPLVWEHGVLPFLVEFIPKWCGPNHVVSVTRGKTPGSRRVCIMTKKKPSRTRRIIIAAHVRDLLPENHRSTITFAFVTGAVDRMVWARGLSKEMPDEVCMAKNPYYFKNPCMGDSIGIDGTEDFKESTSTLGPCLLVGGGSYWLANFHPFVEAYQHLSSVSVEHPSPSDRVRCIDERHDTMPDTDFTIGRLTATSGIDLKTTRISHDPYWEDCDKEAPLIVTDWILIASKTRQANILRRFPSDTMPLLKEVPVKMTSTVVPGATVVSTGRTSGQQRGQICEIPAYVSAEENGTGKATREWFVEEPYPFDDEESWIRGGIGVEGDSGAAIVDADTNALVGQLWGRNKYFGAGPRLTFFTPIGDLFDDIQERCDQQARPQLPQYRDESDCYPVDPSCRQCFDLRTYLDSRRNSRESLRSMIGRNESDLGDLTSIGGTSELATPKDHAFWSRSSGVEEVGSSFTSVMSPSATHPFSFTPQPGTPGIVDVKSPYALTLSAEDLYDEEGFTHTTGVTSGKRAAAVPLARSSSQNAKRQRLH
ncbi:dna polymerase epsilon subunit 1 [Colletotrichum incanum]|uniref:Dna polymerase epsilon subunit 1 n=1 Tax=Colletotrichum incanum TaxID=1573173 RepID=A0A161Y863_COLIC|nr:dna polymerase epsilon subunit 1 [Colletotrichum incanum]